MFRLCPNCGNSNHISARACPCGFQIIGTAQQQTHKLQPDRQETIAPESFQETVFAAAPVSPRRAVRHTLVESAEEARKRAMREKLLAEESDSRQPAGTSIIILKSFLTLASLLVVIGAIFAVWGGFADTTESSEGNADEKEKSASLSADANLASGARRNPANDLAGKNIVKGTVVDVASGDTIRIADANNQEYEIKLEGVDAPEMEQDFGRESQKNLFTLVFGKNVQVVRQTTDADGLIVGTVLVNGTNVNLEQLNAGLAWRDKTGLAEQPENDRYADQEAAARKGGFGLWSAANPLSPWEFRSKANRNQIEQTTVSGNARDATPKDSPNTAPPSKAIVAETKTDTESQTNSTEAVSASANTKSPMNVSQPQPPAKVLTPVPTGYERKTVLISRTATARCKDGTMSLSTTRSGSCSRHGGVAEWFDGSNLPAKTDARSRNYNVGPRGGCYFMNDYGKKVYVDRDLCGN